eukprot:TRINITY_DN15360_c0_g1_i5.p1 TRINITY_DN15360_c0_g1~~TRINITY_DN15360_c0_g1_i5.p1  ORF type:complete len:393 (-),score=66.68 TRINITY_DN15360_c0_g1_i5:68-1198(-)
MPIDQPWTTATSRRMPYGRNDSWDTAGEPSELSKDVASAGDFYKQAWKHIIPRGSVAAFGRGTSAKEGMDSGFGGKKLHALQIGLGTFGTFVQNLAGDWEEWDSTVHWLLDSVSESKPSQFLGVAVEPVAEHVRRLRKLTESRLPHVRLVQTAIGEHESRGTEVHVLTREAHDDLLRTVRPELREELERDLVYLRNMSCVGGSHPLVEQWKGQAWRKYGLDIQLEPLQTDIWSYDQLAKRYDFCGCELLIIDAEGYDAEILRSLHDHCQENEAAWPDLIVFEAAGHCDKREGRKAEEQVIMMLERSGYRLFLKTSTDANLVHRNALERSHRLQKWAQSTVCDKCGSTDAWPFSFHEQFTLCRTCYCKEVPKKWRVW